jgi:AcrR family transcriptional regulator
MARNEEQNKKMREARRDLILSTAVKLFAVRGPAATRISDIAKAVGMSQGLMYHYFKSKEEIFIEIIRMAFKKLNSAARELEQLQISPREKLEIMVDEVVRTVGESDDFVWFSALISTVSISDAIPEAAKDIIRKERDVSYRVVARIAADGQAEGTVRPENASDLAVAFWAAIKGLAMHKAALGSDFRAPSPKVLSSIFFQEVTQ